jgi:DNA-binding transcriptional MerR regulator
MSNSPATPTVDEQWLQLIIEAKRLGISIEEIKQFLKEAKSNE